MKNYMEQETKSLYREQFEHDNCGIGAVVNSKGIKSHKTVENALKIVENLEHRAGKDAEGKTGDGVGILLQISHKFFQKVCKELGISLGEEREYGIAQFFFPQEELQRNQAKKMFEIIVEKEGLELLGFREVPVHPEVLGEKARSCMPHIVQAFIKKPEHVEKGLEFERKLYIARRVFEQSNDNTYVVSMSSRTIVYKGMFLVGQLRTFFADLQDPDYEFVIAATELLSRPDEQLLHQRVGFGAFPFQYEYKSKLGESASEPFYGTQWGNQYDPRKCRQDAGKRGNDGIRCLERRASQDSSGCRYQGI